ncbi:MAG: RNA-splicing factor [Chaenotheca gracillima]|nr:MAG: RNA-splicing factor [Chaenotheca gracillima]
MANQGNTGSERGSSRSRIPHSRSLNPITSSSFRRGSGDRVSSSSSPQRPAPPESLTYGRTSQPKVSSPERQSTYDSSMAEQERTLRIMQLENFEREREMFKQERAMWESEREKLNAKIEHLGFLIQDLGGLSSSVVGSGSNYSLSPPASRTSFKPTSLSYDLHPRASQPGPSTMQPAWRPGTSEAQSGRQVPSAGYQKGTGQLGAIREAKRLTKQTSMPALGSAFARRTTQATPSDAPSMIGEGIDVSHIDSSLDGIPLKRSAVSSTGWAKPFPGQHLEGSEQNPLVGRDSASPGLQTALSPYKPYLTKDAGHTPLPPKGKSAETSPQDESPETPRASVLAAAEGLRTVTEDEEESVGSHDEDPELSGHLTLSNDPDKDEHFLSGVHSRLMTGSTRPTAAPPSDTTASSVTGEEDPQVLEGAEADIPLRFKPAVNFGSSFGSASQQGNRK